jgi:perosamine synthetase
MVVTNDETLYDRAVHFKGQGLAKYREYWHDVVGYNYRMTNICAAIGLAQLEQVGDFLAQKRQVVEWYIKNLEGKVAFHQETGDVYHSYWMFTILVKDSEQRDRVRKALADQGVETRPMFYPVHTMPMYSTRFQKHPVAERIAWTGINLPSFPALSEDQIKLICSIIQNELR